MTLHRIEEGATEVYNLRDDECPFFDYGARMTLTPRHHALPSRRVLFAGFDMRICNEYKAFAFLALAITLIRAPPPTHLCSHAMLIGPYAAPSVGLLHSGIHSCE